MLHVYHGLSVALFHIVFTPGRRLPPPATLLFSWQREKARWTMKASARSDTRHFCSHFIGWRKSCDHMWIHTERSIKGWIIPLFVCMVPTYHTMCPYLFKSLFYHVWNNNNKDNDNNNNLCIEDWGKDAKYVCKVFDTLKSSVRKWWLFQFKSLKILIFISKVLQALQNKVN